MKKEHRKSKRRVCIVPIDGKTGSPFADGQTVDISRTGLGIVSKSKISVNKKIPVEIDVQENGDPIFVVGRVKWVRSIKGSEAYRVGMDFEEVMPGCKTRLNQINKYFSD